MKRDKEASNRQGRFGADGWRLAVISAATVAVLGTTAPSRAQDACEIQQLFPAQPAKGDEFGIAVDISNDVVIVGALRDDDNGFNAGAAYLFRFDGLIWEQEQKISAFNGGAVDDHFGQAVGVDGTTAVIGASVDVFDIDSGAAYIFELIKENWIQIQVLVPLDGEAFDQFGYDVDVSGDAAVVGMPGAGLSSGLVFVYRRDGALWVEEAILTASDGGIGDRFGESVAIDGDVIVVSAINGAGNVAGTGSSYVYMFNGVNWVQHQKMVPFDGEIADLFGTSIAVHGDVAVVGSSRDDDLDEGSGSAYVFRFDGAAYRLQDKLLASDGAFADNFGQSVAIANDTVVVSAVNHDDNGDQSGAVYVFRYDPETESWPEGQEIVPRSADEDDQVGVAVALDGDRAAFGAPGDAENGPDAGSAYVYAGLSGVDCNANGISDACDIFNGTSKDTNDNGVPDECEGTADLDGDGDVDPADLILLLGAWGSCDDCDNCPFDLDDDCGVGTSDLIILLGAWGK